MFVLTPEGMRAADEAACAQLGEIALMRAAGARVASVARTFAGGGRVAGFAGPGNNGGDVFATLAQLGEFERAIYAQPAAHASPARQDAEQRAAASGVRVAPLPQSVQESARALEGCTLAIIGLFGTGARLPLPPQYAPLIEVLNAARIPLVAVDVPPGADAASGRVLEPALRASATVCLGAVKLGLLLEPARDRCGALYVGEIGIPDAMLSERAAARVLDDAEFLALLPERAPESDKRSAGAPFIIAGSQQFPGAAVLCSMGAARAGAGYVTLAAPSAALSAIRAHLIEQVALAIDPDAEPETAADDLLESAKRMSSVAIGPGLSSDERMGAIVRRFAARCTLPMVIDASGLFHFAKHLDVLRGKSVVLTPHEGEFARLSGKGSIAPGERIARLREFVARTGITTLLKGQSTLIDDGATLHVNTTGTSALATAGTGDVLTGIIATLLAQGLSPVDAARAGAYWHGLAAQHAQRRRIRGVIARDVYDALGASLPQPDAPQGIRRLFDSRHGLLRKELP